MSLEIGLVIIVYTPVLSTTWSYWFSSPCKLLNIVLFVLIWIGQTVLFVRLGKKLTGFGLNFCNTYPDCVKPDHDRNTALPCLYLNPRISIS